MPAHEKRGISRHSIEPIWYYGEEIKPPRANVAARLTAAAKMRRAGWFILARSSLKNTRPYRLEQKERGAI